MIDCHMHTLLSDGELIPAELVRRCEARGFQTIVIADHVDEGKIDFVVPRLARFAHGINTRSTVHVVAATELTDCPPEDIARLTQQARRLGAEMVLCHGETIVESVAPGTNRAAILAGVDLLAHPGLITLEDAREAARRGVFLEVSGRKGHSLANGHVVQVARQAKADLIFGSDAHDPAEIITLEYALVILAGAGLDPREAEAVFRNAEKRTELSAVVTV